ncbi:GAF domain-containing protein (plasmid) [Azospirillum humicireducens]|uniref:GAF domain-containing protein n=1 Tax=Azospirillum humicireducens TaxID=1226968 RepID=A0A2R4VWS7_9PROT|nr:GAF domain-containing protein [Azospirillum humicireducens]AWB08831.1 GAF domain-containing protein [Azospirillum humicireducens]
MSDRQDHHPVLTLDAIRTCLEGVIPATIATVAPDGTPNVSQLSQVHYVDPGHIALSYQFFNKTRANILDCRDALLEVIDPSTGAQYRLRLDYLRTETDGPLFESMKAKLSGIASHVGMAEVFRLRGADLFRVTEIEAVPGGRPLPARIRPRSLLSAVRRACEGLRGCADLSDLLDRAIMALRDLFGVEHALILLPDAASGRLFTVAALGYEASGEAAGEASKRGSGIGWEVAPGDGVIGVAARERVPIRITHMTTDVAYSMAMRQGTAAGPLHEIPFPGLERPHSQLAVPILTHEAGDGRGGLGGVLFVESAQEMRFTYDDEDALATLAAQLGALMRSLPAAQTTEVEDPPAEPAPAPAPAPAGGPPITVRHYTTDDSVFLDHDYLIKGVAGAILWKLVREHTILGRTDFTNRELRLAPDIPLPDFAENLEARLILLQRRLDDRRGPLRIEKTGRGRFRLLVETPLRLEEMQ